jgi:hypothetical protein
MVLLRQRVVKIFTSVLFLSLVSPLYAQPTRADWTILVFMNADNNLEPFALQDFAEMAKVGSSDRVNVIVQFDRSPGFAESTPDWTQTLRFRVEKDMRPDPAKALADLGEQNMGAGTVLQEFVRWGKETYPANRYLLVIWDHGQGWRFFQTKLLLKLSPTRLKWREERVRHTGGLSPTDGGHQNLIPLDRTVEPPHRSVSVDDTDHDTLFNREIQDALVVPTTGGKTVDVLGFDACCMGMIETMYAMRTLAEVMVASEELEPGAGWDYSDWLEKLAANPAMDAKQLGVLLVESYGRTYKDRDRTTTLSAVDLSKAESVAKAVAAFADHAKTKLGTELANVRDARASCGVYGIAYNLSGVDIDRFCSQLATRTSDAELKLHSEAVQQALKSAVIANYAGSSRQGRFGSMGLAFYFPENGLVYDEDPDGPAYKDGYSPYPLEFVDKFTWDNFLHAYFDKTR